MPADVITEPCVAADVAEFSAMPGRLTTPVDVELSDPATEPLAEAAEFKAPLALPPTPAVTFVTVPVVAPAVEPTPPSRPPPVLAPLETAPEPIDDIEPMSSPAEA